MESEGFACSESARQTFVVCRIGSTEQAVHNGLDFVYCNREGWREMFTERWQVALVHADGKLTDVLVSNTRVMLLP